MNRNSYGRELSRLERKDRLLRRALRRAIWAAKPKYAAGPPYEVGGDTKVGELPKEWR